MSYYSNVQQWYCPCFSSFGFQICRHCHRNNEIRFGASSLQSQSKKKNPKAQINKLQCRAGSYCQMHGDDDTVQQFKVQFQWSVCPMLRSAHEPGGVEDSRSSLRLRGGATHGGTVPTGCKNSEYSLWVHDAARDSFGHPAGFVHQALLEPGGRAPGASP